MKISVLSVKWLLNSESLKMFLKNTVLIILLSLVKANSHSQWKLVWNDEFNSNRIDLSKWHVESDNNFCTGSHNSQLQCYTESEDNIKQTDNALAIIARKNGKFTSAMVNTNFSFTYGKLEIRAALPTGKLLRPSIWLVDEDNAVDWPLRGQIDVIANTQKPEIYSYVHYGHNTQTHHIGVNFNDPEVLSKISFSDYHVYKVEWSDQWIKWFLDDYQYFNISVNQKFGDIYERNGQPFDHNLKLFLHLGIGGIFFENQEKLTDADVINWSCPVFIIDYIRIFQLSDASSKHNNLNNTQPLDDTNSTANSICTKIMTSYRLTGNTSDNASSHSQWKLVWNDEFNSNRIDLSKWDVERDNNFCTGSHNLQLQCYTGSENNIKQTDNALAIIARKNGKFTSAMVSTKFSFTYGKLEIRAALPTGKLLRPSIWLVDEYNAVDWPLRGQIDVMTNIQKPEIYSYVHYKGDPGYKGVDFKDRKVLSTIDFADYHVYKVEWSDQWIKWFLDDYQYFNISVNQKFGDIYERNGQPFDHNLKLFLHLGIGGIFFQNHETLTDADVINWPCPVFLIDYIRIFQLNDSSSKHNNLNKTEPLDDTISSPNSICPKRMTSNAMLTGIASYVWWILVVVVVVILLTTFPVYLYVSGKRRQTKPDIMTDAPKNSNNYNSGVHYDQAYYDNCNEEYDEINNAEFNGNYVPMSSKYTEILE